MYIRAYKADHSDDRAMRWETFLGSPSFSILAILVFLITATQVIAQAVPSNSTVPQYDPLNLFCVRELFKTTIINNILYLDGGVWTADNSFPNGIYVNGTLPGLNNEHLWTVDLSKSFSAAKPPWQTHLKVDTTTSQAVYSGSVPTLWNNGNGSYFIVGGWFSVLRYPGQFFGEPYLTTSTNTFHLPPGRIFQYDSDSVTWTSQPLSGGAVRVSNAAFATSKSLNIGFSVGGIRINEYEVYSNGFPSTVTDSIVGTLTIYNMDTGQWKGETLPPSIGTACYGNLHALERVGKNGVLVYFGGQPDVEDPMGNNLTTIHVYDIDTGNWYQQQATGDTPPPRVDGCSVMVPSPDSSSFQIYLFAGRQNVFNRYLLDLYVLSVPLFQWIKIPLGGYPDQYGISMHECTVYEDRQMLIIPGDKNATNGTSGDWHICEKDGPIAIFDTYEWTFKQTFDPSLKQNLVPTPIVKLAGGTATEGKATVSGPKNGWDDGTLGAIFKIRNTAPTPTPAPKPTNTAHSNSTFSTNNQHTTSKTTHAAIGGAIGGAIAGVLLISALLSAFLFFRNKKQKQQYRPGGMPQELMADHPSLTQPVEAPNNYIPPAELDSRHIGGSDYK